VTRTGGPSVCVAARGINLVYEDQDAPLIEYWINEGADVLMGGRRYPTSSNLAWWENINNATFTASVNTSTVKSATLGVVSPWAGSSWEPGMTNYLFFNDEKLGTGVYHGYGETYDKTIDSITMHVGSTNGQVGVNVTNVTALYLKGSDNVAGQCDDGDNMMPCNAFLVVEYGSPTTNEPPVADAGADQIALVNETVMFNGSDSYDPDGTIVSYDWDFGDGTNGTGEATTCAYATAGTYTVTLTVTDDDGATGTDTALVLVNATVPNEPPVADAGPDQNALVNETVMFNGSGSYDPDGTIVSYDWNFGDETNGTGETTMCVYATAGTYTVTLTVTDDEGATGMDTALVLVNATVPNEPPVADAGPDQNALVNETVTFNGSGSYDPDGTIVSYEWDFGDGNNATGETTTCAYATAGTYTVTLTVTDDEGATGTDTASVNVVAEGIIQAGVTLSPKKIDLNSSGVLKAYITLPEGYDVADINVSTIECEGAPVFGFGKVIPGKQALEVKFKIQDLNVTTGDEVLLTVTGELDDGTPFEGSNTVEVV
jgi:PKD repeat protein